MSIPAIVVLAAIVLVAVVLFVVRAAQETEIRVEQIPQVVAQLRATGKDASFAVLRFAGAGEPTQGEHLADLQFSIEDGRLGLDWTLLAKRNIADKERIAAFIRDHGHAVNERRMNGVDYLRVEDGDLAQLGVAIACEAYGRPGNSLVDLIVEGFDWPPGDGDPGSHQQPTQ